MPYLARLFTQKLAETYQLMLTIQPNAVRQHPVFGRTLYGYGITVDEKDGLLQVGQTGYSPGFVSMNFYFPATKTSAIIVSNVAYDAENDLKKTFTYHTRILDEVRLYLMGK
jgi:D-alanyl-D-alanine carboxypeptidase